MDTSSTRELSFGRTTDIHLPISFRLARLEGKIQPKSFKQLQQQPELKHLGTQQSCVDQLQPLPSTTLSDLDLFVVSNQRPLGPLRDCPAVVRGTSSLNHSTDEAQGVHQVIHVSPHSEGISEGENADVSNRIALGRWNEFLTIPVQYSSLMPTAQLAFTVWDCLGAGQPTPIGGSTMRLFEQPGRVSFLASLPLGLQLTIEFSGRLVCRYLRQGEHRLYLYREVEADGSLESTTPHDVDLGPTDEMGRLEGVSWLGGAVEGAETDRQHHIPFRQLVRKFERGDIPKLEWLDRLTFKEIEKVHAVRRKPRDSFCKPALMSFLRIENSPFRPKL